MIDPATLIFAAGQIVPGILRWLGRDNAADVVGQAVNVAKSMTGHGDPVSAIEAIKAAPALLVEYQKAMNSVFVAQLDAEARDLETVNATMRAEYASNDPYVRRARPTFLYVMALTWAAQALGLLWATIFRPDLAPAVITAAAGLTGMWTVALTVVGVAVKARSDDKARAQGLEASSLTDALGKMFTKKAPA